MKLLIDKYLGSLLCSFIKFGHLLWNMYTYFEYMYSMLWIHFEKNYFDEKLQILWYKTSPSYVYDEVVPRVKGHHYTKASIAFITLTHSFSPDDVTIVFPKDKNFSVSSYMKSLPKRNRGYCKLKDVDYK